MKLVSAQDGGTSSTNTRSVWTTYKSICIGDSSFVSLLEDFSSVVWCVYSHNGIYDTSYTTGIILKPDTNPNNTLVYVLETVNGVVPTDSYQWIVSSKIPSTISIPSASIHHVTCPDGLYYPYMNGSFHVSLDDSLQNYAWIRIEVDTPFFFVHTSYDSVTLTGLRAGIYHVTSHGTNGCEYRDSVIIEQPDPWIDTGVYADTVCTNETGCINLGLYGGTPPYNFTWFYYSDTGQVFMPDTTRLVCGLNGGGSIYCVYMYDSRGCKFFGEEIEYVFCYLYEYVEDSTHIITIDSIACYGREFIVQAQSIGEGTYTWYVGDVVDSVNYWTGVYGDSMFVADYYTPPITDPTWVYAEFSDQHHCVTRDSIWVEVYNSNISLTIETPNIVTDSTCTVSVSPPGGNLFVDGVVVGYNIPSNYIFSTDGISVGEHTLRYAGIFGAEMGVGCDDEISIPIQVETNPFVSDWEYEISIYPNPTTTVLNLASTGTSDFELSILDITGKIIKSGKMLEQTFTFDVSDLASGMYMLRLVSRDGASKIVKFVKR